MLIYLVQVLKVGMPHVVFKFFTPQEEALGFEYPPEYKSLCLGWGLWRDCVSASSTTFSVFFFFFFSYDV